MIRDFMGRRPLFVRDHVVSIKDGPLLSNKMSKVWRLYVRRIYIDSKLEVKTSFLSLNSPHMESPDFLHFISGLGTVLYRIHLVPDR